MRLDKRNFPPLGLLDVENIYLDIPDSMALIRENFEAFKSPIYDLIIEGKSNIRSRLKIPASIQPKPINSPVWDQPITTRLTPSTKNIPIRTARKSRCFFQKLILLNLPLSFLRSGFSARRYTAQAPAALPAQDPHTLNRILRLIAALASDSAVLPEVSIHPCR